MAPWLRLQGTHTPNTHTHHTHTMVAPSKGENRPTGWDGSQSPRGTLASLVPACPWWPDAEGWATRAEVRNRRGLGAGDQTVNSSLAVVLGKSLHSASGSIYNSGGGWSSKSFSLGLARSPGNSQNAVPCVALPAQVSVSLG